MDPSKEKTNILEKEEGVGKIVMRKKRGKRDKRSVVISRLKRRALKHLWLVRAGVLLGTILGIYLTWTLLASVIRETRAGYYIGIVSDFIVTPKERIESLSGRTNLLILGKGGEGHVAPDLTDTIIFASVKHQPESVTLISLSRDIWVPEIRAKLNSAYFWGNQKREGGGLILAKATAEEIVGTPVHYGVVIDFSGFKKIINELGGIEVEVERNFVDRKYPLPGREDDDCGGKDPEFLCRYETIQFEAGKQLMDGETALKFARSRNAEGDEGTDFARAARQQKVIEAVREKALSRKILLNPKKILNLIKVAQEAVETDIDSSAFAILARRILEARDKVVSRVLPEQFLENPPISPRYDNQYVFIPKAIDSESGNPTWTEVNEWVECVLKNGECE